MEKNVNIRIASLQDAKALLDIYTPYVEKTVITFEYEAPTLQEFTHRIAGVLPKYPFLVAELEGRAVGFAYAGAFRGRAAYNRAVEVTVYVDESMKKMGIGKTLYEALEKVLAAQNILNLNACIASPIVEDEHLTRNSIEFHRHLGYRLVGEFNKCGYKFGRWYNMLWMEKHIGVHGENPPQIVPFEDVRDAIAEKYGIR